MVVEYEAREQNRLEGWTNFEEWQREGSSGFH